MQNLFAIDWIPSFNIQYLMGTDGISFPLVVLTAFVSLLAMGASWPIKKYVNGVLRAVPAARNRHARRVLCPRLLPVLRVLGSDAAADVLPHRHLGRPAEGIRGDQVLPVHAARQRVDADRDPDAVFQQRPAQAVRRSDSWPPASSARSSTKRRRQTGVQAILDGATQPQHTFNILALQQLGQHTDQFTTPSWWRPFARSGGRSCCCSSALPSKCRSSRSTPGCPMPTSKRRRRSP